MRWSLSLISVLVCAACTVRLPRPGEIGIQVKTTTRVQVQVKPTTEVVVPLRGAPVVEFFGIPLEGIQDVVFVLDCSGSMADLAQGRIAEIAPDRNAPPPPPPDPNAPPPPPPDPNAPPPPVEVRASADQPRKIDVAQAELVDALERLPAGTRMNIVFFNSDLEGFAPSMVPLEETARAGLIGFVKETVPAGATALAPAMRTAFLMNARRIVLLSDGLGNVGGNAEAVLRDAREAIRGGVRIDTIGLGSSQNARLLQSLAGESGGRYQGLKLSGFAVATRSSHSFAVTVSSGSRLHAIENTDLPSLSSQRRWRPVLRVISVTQP